MRVGTTPGEAGPPPRVGVGGGVPFSQLVRARKAPRGDLSVGLSVTRASILPCAPEAVRSADGRPALRRGGPVPSLGAAGSRAGRLRRRRGAATSRVRGGRRSGRD